MIAALETTELSENDLIFKPLAQTLATGRNVTVFSVKESAKTLTLKTGNRFYCQDKIYEVMNIYKVQGRINHIKFNCIER